MHASSPNADTLTLVCPDWRRLEHPLRLPDPFILWPIGDQPLLYHWFDHALDHGYKHLQIYVVDRPHRIREAVNQATLWPISMEVVTVSQIRQEVGVLMNGLPSQKITGDPGDQWDLLDHWQEMDRKWLEKTQSAALDVNISVGRLCRIHASAKLHPPYFIGDHVAIGPDAEIGPNAVIGSDSVVAEGSIIRNARLMPHGFLGANLTLEQSILYGRVLFNCKNRARVERIESFIADTTSPQSPSPPFSERLTALWYWLRFRIRLLGGLPDKAPSKSLNGESHTDPATGPLWAERLPNLWEAFRGRMRLYGPLPRSDEQLEGLPPEWQSILRDAPPGAIAYSDCVSCHSPEDPSEALHAVYQVTHPEQTRSQCEYFLQQLTHH